MKQYFILTCLILFLSAFGDGPEQAWYKGSWTGTGYQANVGELWTIRLVCDEVENKYVIKYPSVTCSGRLELVSCSEKRAEFKDITDVPGVCMANGRIVLIKTDATHITFSYYAQGSDTIGNYGKLEKVKAGR
jgi:hypothetical protein